LEIRYGIFAMSDEFDPNAAAGPDSGIFGLDDDPEKAAVHLIPVPFDATSSYRKGAARGPEAILAASHQVELHDPLLGDPWRSGIRMAPIDERVRAWNAEANRRAAGIIERGGEIGEDAGLAADLAAVNAIGAELNDWVHARSAEALDAGKLVGVVGGDHSVSFGSIVAHAERYPGMGILHIDAHADLREAYEGFTWSHASILHNVVEQIDSIGRIVQVGIRDLCGAEAARIEEQGERIHTIFDHEWAQARLLARDFRGLVRQEIEVLPREVYITFDIDGLDPHLCPNTGTPVPGGLRWNDAMLVLGELVASGRRIIGFDLVEVAPGSERPPGDGIDEIVGARLLYRLIGFARQAPR
jgi:agmatinase